MLVGVGAAFDFHAGTVARAAALPAGAVDEPVGGEWSFAQTLRHLVLATDPTNGKTAAREVTDLQVHFPITRGVIFDKIVGFVNAAPGFTDIPPVINGVSDLMVEVFGEAGRHARSAVGVYKLPLNFAVEVDAVVEVR